MMAARLFHPRILALASCLFVATAYSVAQVPTSADAGLADSTLRPQQIGVSRNSETATAVESERQKAADQIRNQEKQRILGVMPQFNVSNISDAVPLSPGQKFQLAFKTATDPATFLFAGVSSGISQANNSFPGYGQGAQGYAKRFGASYLDSFDGTIIGNAALPILLRQDPRYFRKADDGIAVRLGYAVLSTFRCKSDTGDSQPNYSNVLGNLAAGGISNLYYPAGERGFVSTYQRAIVVSGEGAIGAILSEFWPDISHHVFPRNREASADERP